MSKIQMVNYQKLSSSEQGDDSSKVKVENEEEKMMPVSDFLIVIKPYFWPDDGSESAIINRLRSSCTWLMVACSKTTNIIAPIYLSRATNALVDMNFKSACANILLYCSLRFASSFFKEMQSIVYLKVKQQANIQLAVLAFSHIHSLSLNWHLSKKMGNVIRSMDRGTAAADTLVYMYIIYFLFYLTVCFVLSSIRFLTCSYTLCLQLLNVLPCHFFF
jgi:ABC-type multidrug transport system fused ATPase/permease subunit